MLADALLPPDTDSASSDDAAELCAEPSDSVEELPHAASDIAAVTAARTIATLFFIIPPKSPLTA